MRLTRNSKNASDRVIDYTTKLQNMTQSDRKTHPRAPKCKSLNSKKIAVPVPGGFGVAGAPHTADRRGGAASRAEGARGGPPFPSCNCFPSKKCFFWTETLDFQAKECRNQPCRVWAQTPNCLKPKIK